MRKRQILKQTIYGAGEEFIRVDGLSLRERYRDPAIYSTYGHTTSMFKTHVAIYFSTGHKESAGGAVRIKRPAKLPRWKKDKS